MPDESDVAKALKTTVELALYPNGISQPSVAGTDILVGRGWPSPADLDAAGAGQRIIVSIAPRPNMSRSMTIYQAGWKSVLVPSTLTVALAGTTATFAGVPQVGQVAGVVVNKVAYPYRIKAGDTLASIAAAIGALIAGSTVSGATVSAPLMQTARAGNDSISTRETARQVQHYMLAVWCADPAQRDLVGDAVHSALAGLTDANDNIRPFMYAADGTEMGPVAYDGSNEFDKGENSNVYRRDEYWRVEYPTLQTRRQPILLFPGLALHGSPGEMAVESLAPNAGP